MPFASSREEIADFLEVRPIDIVFQERGGRPNGVAFVLLSSSDDYQQCLDKDKQNLGSRYIEVFPCARSVRTQITTCSQSTYLELAACLLLCWNFPTGSGFTLLSAICCGRARNHNSAIWNPLSPAMVSIAGIHAPEPLQVSVR